jgi:hypothetical protein
MWPSFIVGISDPIMEKRERTRSWLAYGATGLVGVIALTLVSWAFVRNGPFDAVVTGVFTPLIGIAGTVIGFYFAGEREQQAKDNIPPSFRERHARPTTSKAGKAGKAG